MTWADAPRILESTDIAAVYTDTHEPVVTLDNGQTALVLYVIVREDSAKHPAVADVPAYLALPEMPARLLPVETAFIADSHPPTLDVPAADPAVLDPASLTGDPVVADEPEADAGEADAGGEADEPESLLD